MLTMRPERLRSLKCAAHWAQNFACGGFSVPHEGQRRANGDAHSMQNLASSRLSAPQLEQRIFSLTR
jgi:hypothetical protein